MSFDVDYMEKKKNASTCGSAVAWGLKEEKESNLDMFSADPSVEGFKKAKQNERIVRALYVCGE